MNALSLDELLAFPNEDKQDGGAIDSDFNLIAESSLPENTINIHTTPVILTAKQPATTTTPKLSEFFGDSALTVNDIIAINGKAVQKIISNPMDKSKDILQYLFVVPAGKTYEDISEISEKQVAFICFFHHLFFLAKIAKIPSFPMFTDSFGDKFVALQQKLSEESETNTKIFGADTTAITGFWTELSTSLGVRETLFDMIGLFEKSPLEIYDYFLVRSEADTVIDHNETSTARGYNEMSEVEGTVGQNSNDEKSVEEPTAAQPTDTETESAATAAEPKSVEATDNSDADLEKLEKIMD